MPVIKGNLSQKEFYTRSLTWGLLSNIGGAAVALGMLATGHKPKKYGSCIQFDVGRKGWGGGSVGMFMFTCPDADDNLKKHELGHSVQTCYYGPFMPFVVNLPSSARFWSRKLIEKVKPNTKLPPYESVWFESEASELGEKYFNFINSGENND